VNDLETKLRTLPFRPPPPGLRGSVLAATQTRIVRRMPHPAAWAALAALWLVLAVLGRLLDAGETPIQQPTVRQNLPTPPTLLAHYRDPTFHELAY
jgi:hypothetical protein